MEDLEETETDPNRSLHMPIVSIGLILGYFASQMVTFILAGIITGVELKEVSDTAKFITIAVNAAIWIVIVYTVTPKLKLPKTKVSKPLECLKYYFAGVGIMYLTLIYFGNILYLTGFKPETQKVAADIKVMGEQSIFLALIGPAILIPLIEELLFRSLLYRSIKISLSPLAAAIISAAIFGLVHVEPDVIPQLVALGLVFSYIYEKSGSILVASALHATNNSVAIIFMVYGPDINEWLQTIEKQLQSAGFCLPVFG